MVPIVFEVGAPSSGVGFTDHTEHEHHACILGLGVLKPDR